VYFLSPWLKKEKKDSKLFSAASEKKSDRLGFRLRTGKDNLTRNNRKKI